LLVIWLGLVALAISAS